MVLHVSVYVQRSKLINKPLQWAPALCKAGPPLALHFWNLASNKE